MNKPELFRFDEAHEFNIPGNVKIRLVTLPLINKEKSIRFTKRLLIQHIIAQTIDCGYILKVDGAELIGLPFLEDPDGRAEVENIVMLFNSDEDWERISNSHNPNAYGPHQGPQGQQMQMPLISLPTISSLEMCSEFPRMGLLQ